MDKTCIVCNMVVNLEQIATSNNCPMGACPFERHHVASIYQYPRFPSTGNITETQEPSGKSDFSTGPTATPGD